MITILKGKEITVEWKVLSLDTKQPVDFEGVNAKVFLLAPDNIYTLPFDVVRDDFRGLRMTIPTGYISTGVYDIKVIWLKDALKDKPVYRNVSVKREVFALTDEASEVTYEGDTIKIATGVESCGRDGLSAYEIAVFRGFAKESSEKEWVESLDNVLASEESRVEAEEKRVKAEDERVKGEDLRIRIFTNGEEDRRQSFEISQSSRADAFDDSEAQRQSIFESKEAQRDANENSRMVKEEQRKIAESSRKSNEQGRETAESGRVSAESTRVADENIRKANEQDRVDAEKNRVNAETSRANAEVARANTENTRKSNEQARVSAENRRVSAENGRVSAEAAREAAEGVREATFQANEAAREAEFGKAIQAAKDNLVVVNDLTTGGADKALSAEMGMALRKSVSEGLSKITGNLNEPIDLVEGGYYNMSQVTLGGTFLKVNPSSTSGYSSLRLKVQAGETYRIVGEGLSNAVGLYVLTDKDSTVIQFVRATNGRQDIEINVEQEGWLYYNKAKSNEDYGVTRINAASTLKDLQNSITELNEEVKNIPVVEIINNLTAGGTDKALSAEMGKKLNESVQINEDENIVMIEGKYYNTSNKGIGDSIIYSPAASSYAQCVKLTVKKGEKYKITGYGTPAVGLYALADADNVIIDCLFVADRRDNPVILDIVEDGYLYVNNYTPQEGDGVIRVKTITIKDIYEKSLKSNKPLEGKKIVCFGDSLTEFKDLDGKRYSDYVSEITGAEVINVGIGGTQIRRRRNPIVTPISDDMNAYAGLDIVSLIEAAVSGDFTIVDECVNWVKDNANDDNTANIERLKAIDWNQIDAVTFMAGANDHKNGRKLGTEGGSSVLTTLGAINTILSTFMSKYPHIKVYWFTPTVRYVNAKSLEERTDDVWSDVWTNTEEKTLPQYIEAITQEVRKWHIPVCDMYWSLGWNKANFSNYFVDTDGTHPYKGFDVIGRKIASYLIANKTF